jgi:hypothetical protein
MDASATSLELSRLEAILLDPARRVPVALTREWAFAFPREAGVYAWFEDGKLIYVGESGLLWERLDDARVTMHHSLRRSLGNERLCQLQGFVKVNNKTRFVPELEAKLDDILKALFVCAVPVSFGRKEFEEFMIAKHRPRYNKKERRGACVVA